MTRWQFVPSVEGTLIVRILCVTNMYPSPQRPGSGAFVCQQVEQLRRFGHTVDVIDILGSQSKMNYLRCTLDVMRMTSAGAYDVVHAHYGYSAYPAMFRSQACTGPTCLEKISLKGCARGLCRISPMPS